MGMLSDIGYAVDTPGALLRGLLAGKPGARKSGREMLESWGALGPNKEGFDSGDVAGFLADLIVDPINLAGGWAAKGLAKTLGRQVGARRTASVAAKLRQPAMVTKEAPVSLASMPRPHAAKRHIVPDLDYTGTPTGLTSVDRNYISTMKQAGADLGAHYERKWDPVAKNVVNPESGISLFDQPGPSAFTRIRRMLHKNVEVGPGAPEPNIADYVPESVGTFVGPGTKTFTLPVGGNIRYNKARLSLLHPDQVNKTGTHEFAHYLTNGNTLLSTNLFDKLMQVGHRAARVRDRAFMVRGKPPRTLGVLPQDRILYLSNPTEMLSRVATTRMASEGLHPGLVNQLLRSPKTASAISDDTADLVEAFGPRLTKYLLRVLPAVPLAGAAGYGMSGRREDI